MGGTAACPLIGGADSHPSGGCTLSLGVIRGSCGLCGWVVFGSLFADGSCPLVGGAGSNPSGWWGLVSGWD